jgi:DNA-binding GntR family transcriptional regulator
VECEPQRYTRVSQVGARDAHDTFPLLAAVHGLATELAVPKLTGDDIVALERTQEAFLVALRNADPHAAFAADEAFHRVFVTCACNPQVEQALEHLDPSLHRMERFAIHALPGARSVAQHQAIIERSTAGNAAGAATAARANWLTLGALVEQALGARATAPRAQ